MAVGFILLLRVFCRNKGMYVFQMEIQSKEYI